MNTVATQDTHMQCQQYTVSDVVIYRVQTKCVLSDVNLKTDNNMTSVCE